MRWMRPHPRIQHGMHKRQAQCSAACGASLQRRRARRLSSAFIALTYRSFACLRAGTVSESFRSERNGVEVERDGGEAIGQHECNPRHTRTATPRLHDRSTERNVFGVSSGTSSRIANARRWRTYRFFGLLSWYSRVISLVCRSTSRATLKPILCASS